MATPAENRGGLLGAHCRPASDGQGSFEGLDLLVRVRNAVVHGKPVVSTLLAGSDPQPPEHALLSDLRDCGILTGSSHAGARTWMDVLDTPTVAAWAYDTALRIMRGLVEVPGGGFGLMMRMLTRDLPVASHSAA